MVSPLRVGLVFGVFLGLWHTIWSLLVAAKLAQKLIDFVFWLHFIVPPYHIEPFEPARAAMLVGVTFAIGFIAGTVGSVIWNGFHRG